VCINKGGLASEFSEDFPGIRNGSWVVRSSLNGFSRVIKVAPERTGYDTDWSVHHKSYQAGR